MKRTLIVLTLMLAVACSNDGPAATSNAGGNAPAVASQQQAELTPEQLGELGAEIKKNPKDAQRLLSARGLNEQTFEQAIRKISEDPAAAKRYSDSYKKTGA